MPAGMPLNLSLFSTSLALFGGGVSCLVLSVIYIFVSLLAKTMAAHSCASGALVRRLPRKRGGAPFCKSTCSHPWMLLVA